METLSQILVNLVSTFIGFLLGITWRRSLRALAYWRGRRFWRPFLKANLKIVLGRVGDFRDFEASGFVGFGDMQAVAELVSALEEFRFSRTGRTANIVFDDHDTGELEGFNLICLGGPDANRLTRRVLSDPKYSRSFLFGATERHVITITSTETGKYYNPSFDMSEAGRVTVASDHGLLAKAQSPFDRKRSALVIAGCFGFGTWGGVKLARSADFLCRDVVSRGAAMECVYEVPVVNDMPQAPEVREIKLLDQ